MKIKYNKLDALEKLLANLYKYLELVADCLDNKASHEERRTAFTLNSEIVSSLGYLQNLVNGLCVPFAANMTNEWFKALKLPINTEARNALLVCIQATNKAIGKMKNDIKIGTRNKLGILRKITKLVQSRLKPLSPTVEGLAYWPNYENLLKLLE